MSNDEVKIQVSSEKIPEALQHRDQWVCWRYETHGGKEKKVPLNPESLSNASTNDSTTWSSFRQAKSRLAGENVDGVGFVFTSDDPYVGVDLDDCRDPQTGRLTDQAGQIVEDLDSYTEVSPSREGLHTILQAGLPQGRKHGDGIEVYDTGRYFTVTGRLHEGSPTTVKERSLELKQVHDEYVANGDAKSGSITHEPINENALPDVTDDLVARAEAEIREFYHSSKTSCRARRHLDDLLNGRYKKQEFISDDGSADRHEAEINLAGLLYGIFRNEDHPERLVWAYMTKACKDNRVTRDRQPRKWRRGKSYRQGTIQQAVDGFDKEVWQRWRQKKDQWDTWTDDYSDLTYETVRLATFQEAYEGGEDYGAKREIIERCQQMDPTRSERTHQTALTRLRDEYGQIKMAHLGGNDYVYYPAHMPDPSDAEYVKVDGEKHKPEVSEEIQTPDNNHTPPVNRYDTPEPHEGEGRGPVPREVSDTGERERREQRQREAAPYKAERRRRSKVEARRERVDQL